MPELIGTRTYENLIEAFTRECQDSMRFSYFAQKADVEGRRDVASLFRAVADGETSHAFGDLDLLFEIHDPVTGVSVGASVDNLRSAVEGEWHYHVNMYPGFARVARDEGFEEAAEWFEMLAIAERNHARLFEESLERLGRADR